MATQEQLDAVIRAKRTRHPELREPVSWQGFLRVCDREGVAVIHAPLPVDGVMLTALGTGVIVLNSLVHRRRDTYRGIHELAHHWLHGELEPTVYTMREDAGPDEREDDVEYVATVLLQRL